MPAIVGGRLAGGKWYSGRGLYSSAGEGQQVSSGAVCSLLRVPLSTFGGVAVIWGEVGSMMEAPREGVSLLFGWYRGDPGLLRTGALHEATT